MIDLKGRDKAEVLAKLYNASKPLGFGIFHYDPKPMTVEEAQALLDSSEISLAGDELDPWLYDRDNGEGAAERALG